MPPSTKEVIPGAPVNIVLKADQPTGRTVSGTVSTVLTRGNHPRGIKVRLSDGRVGRVQSIGSGASVPASTPAPAPASTAISESGPSQPSQHIGLDAYITRPKRNGKKNQTQSTVATDTAATDAVDTVNADVVCPVCGEFNGDEAAVAHHVAGHFD